MGLARKDSASEENRAQGTASAAGTAIQNKVEPTSDAAQAGSRSDAASRSGSSPTTMDETAVNTRYAATDRSDISFVFMLQCKLPVHCEVFRQRNPESTIDAITKRGFKTDGKGRPVPGGLDACRAALSV
jgi:hypothetical protein